MILQFVLNVEKGLPFLPEWLSFTRVNARARKGVEIGPARLHLRYDQVNLIIESKRNVLFTL